MEIIKLDHPIKYRVCYDDQQDIWHQLPLWTTAQSVQITNERNDNLEDLLGRDFMGVTNDLTNSDTAGYVFDSSIARTKPYVMYATLSTSATQLTFQSNKMFNNALIDVYTDDPDVQPYKMTLAPPALTLFFSGTRAKDVNVAVTISSDTPLPAPV